MTFSPDWTFQNHYNWAQIAARELAAGRFPLVDQGLGAGSLFLERYGIVPSLEAGVLINLLGPDGGVRVFMIGSHLLIGVGAYLAASRLLGRGWPAWVASIAYLFSYWTMFQLSLNGSFTHAQTQGLLGWAFWAYEGTQDDRRLRWTLATAGILALAIATHPQPTLKIYFFLLIWTAVTRQTQLRRHVTAAILRGLIIFCVPVALVAYKVVEWLSLYTGAIGLGMVEVSEPWRTPLTNLFVLPQFILGLGVHRLTGSSTLSVPYLAAEGSDYVGLVVIGLAIIALASSPPRAWPPPVRALCVILAVIGVCYYILPSVPGMAQLPGYGAIISVRYRWMFLVAFSLAMLAGYGARAIAEWARGHRSTWPFPVITAVLLTELAGVSLVQAGAVGTHVRPLDLPLLADWRRSGLPGPRERERRVMDFVRGGRAENAAALVPWVVGVPSANPDLLMTTANELSSFYSDLRNDLLIPGREVGLAERLALLDVGTLRIDATALPADPVERMQVLDRLTRNSGLQPIDVHEAVTGYYFRNPSPVVCAVARGVIALVGDGEPAVAAFHRIAHLPGFHAGSLLVVLLDNPRRLPPEGVSSLWGSVAADGQPLPPSWPSTSLGEVDRLFVKAGGNHRVLRCKVRRPDSQTVHLSLPPREGPGFVFLSQAYFEQPGYVNPWSARDDTGRELPTVKAGGGLTAIWAPAHVREIQLRFHVPGRKRTGAWISLVSGIGYAAALAWAFAGRSRAHGRASPPGGRP